MSEMPQSQAARSSFYLGMRILPKARRDAMYAIYAFCRAVDDIADDQQGDRTSRAAALQAWRDDVDALYAGGDAGRAAFLRRAVVDFDLARDDFHTIIDGMAMDVAEDIRWPPAAVLDLYCDRVASAVGRLSVKAFGMDAKPGIALAHHLGRALQLTNILRDIDEDAAIGRVYLSREALEAAGIEPSTPQALTVDPRLDGAARVLERDAHMHFDAARAILHARPKGHLLAPRLMEVAYARLLARMESRGWAPPRVRPRTNKVRILFTVLRLGLTR